MITGVPGCTQLRGRSGAVEAVADATLSYCGADRSTPAAWNAAWSQ